MSGFACFNSYISSTPDRIPFHMKMDVLRFEPRLSIVIRRRTALPPNSNARENEAHAAQMAAEPITVV
jgi:hypothetical protein